MPKEKKTILEQEKFKKLAKYALELKKLNGFRSINTKKEGKSG
jgi:hypothetical protein